MGEKHVREDLGAYVLGALESVERRAVESHVLSCAVCRDDLARLSGLPPLLDRVSADEVLADLGSVVPDVTPGVIDALATAARASERRIRLWQWATATAAAVALFAVVGLIRPFVGSEPPPQPLVLELRPIAADADAVDGTASAYAWEWGTTVEIEVAGLPERSTYVLWAISEEGERQTAGMWGPTEAGAAQVRGASAIQREQLQALEVRDETGALLMGAEVTES